MGSRALLSQHIRRDTSSSESNSFKMDVNVEYDGGDPIPVKNVKTVGELKEKLRETEDSNFDMYDNFDDWKLCQGDKELDDPNMLLDELPQSGEGITLVKPEEEPKGNEKSRRIISDKTRYIVFHDSMMWPKHKIYKVEKGTIETAKGSRTGYVYPFYLWGAQEIGLITNVIRINDNERQVKCESYKMEKDGHILLLTEGQEVKVKLLHKNQRKDLEPLPNPKTYLEKDLEYIKKEDHRTTTEILNLLEGEEGAGEGAGAGGAGEAGEAGGAGDA